MDDGGAEVWVNNIPGAKLSDMAKINDKGEFTCDGCGAKAKAYLCQHWVHDNGQLLCGKCQKKKKKTQQP